jgi:hypothetical protein
MIKFNEVTWYSRIAAIIIFVGILPMLTFFIGIRYKEVKDMSHQDNSTPITNIPQVSQDEISIDKDIYFNLLNNSNKQQCVGNYEKSTCVFSISVKDNSVYGFIFEHDNGSSSITISNGLGDETNQPRLQVIDIDSLPLETGYEIKYGGLMQSIDINFDGFNDLALRTCVGATGNECYAYFLFNPQTEQFEFSKEFTDAVGVNKTINFETKEIKTIWDFGCANACFTAETYKIENHHPVLTKSTSQDVDMETNQFVRVTKELIDGTFITSTTTLADAYEGMDNL